MQRFRLARIALLLSLFIASSLFAADHSVLIGGASGWSGLSYLRSIDTSPGRLGYPALVLSSASSAVPKKTDLYLTFDREPFLDNGGLYSVVSSSLLSVGPDRAFRGRGAALCNTVNSGLVLSGGPGSIFSSQGNPGSFTVEFWMQPVVTENGSVLFQWRSSRTSGGRSLYQYVRSSLFNNRMVWNFSNIWITSAGVPLDITLTGRTNLIPGSWAHHRLVWDDRSGVLEYSLNGITEDIRYITSTGTESGDVYAAVFGAAADIEIAPRFSGLLDEFIIVRDALFFDSLAERRALTDRYPSAGGRFETNVIDSGNPGSSLESVTAVMDLPNETGITLFARAGDDLYLWTATEPAWIPIRQRVRAESLTGRYFQVAGELYTDGTGKLTPSLSSITIQYRGDEPPWPPARLFAVPEDKSVNLSWPASVDSDVAGYLVYYGERPGEYLGANSPIDAGSSLSLRVEGLGNERTWYFAVAAYDSAGKTRPGPLSIEVWARPEAGIRRER